MKNKSGFTIAEMLIALGIISILTGAAIFTFKPFDKGIKYLYSNIYENLDRAFYNIMTYDIPKNDYSNPFSDTNKDGNTYTRRDDEDTGTEELCKRLISYISTVENDESTCSSTKIVSKNADNSNFVEGKVQFTAVNGVRFFISRMYPEDKDTAGERFYVIYADLNGENGPNSVEYIPPSKANNFKTTDPDIFAFAALESGRICPLGAPEVDTRYLSTRIRYQDDTNGVTYKYTVNSMPYIYSKAEAWGYYLPADHIPDNCGEQGDYGLCTSYKKDDDNNDVQDSVDDAYVIPNGSPYSYNGYVRNILKTSANVDSNIYSFLLYDPKNEGAKNTVPVTMSEYFQHSLMCKDEDGIFNVIFKSDEIANGGYKCRLKSDEECEVVIDKYRQ